MVAIENCVASLPWQRLRRLYYALQSGGSATEMLERWGREWAPTEGTELRAEQQPLLITAPAAVRAWFAPVQAGELQGRRVRLCWGGRVLSEADNWYLPTRLDAAMVVALNESELPFGRVVHGLGFWREPQQSWLLWRPRRGSNEHELPWHVLEHRAVLYRPERLVISVVCERYTRELLELGMNSP